MLLRGVRLTIDSLTYTNSYHFRSFVVYTLQYFGIQRQRLRSTKTVCSMYFAWLFLSQKSPSMQAVNQSFEDSEPNWASGPKDAIAI